MKLAIPGQQSTIIQSFMVKVAAGFLLTRQRESQDVVGRNKTETQFVSRMRDLHPHPLL